MPVTNFIWDELSDNVLLETDENDVVTAAYHHRPEQFGELLSQNRSGIDRFFHFDGKHSTSDLTASNQIVTDTFSYTAYGEEVARTGATTNSFGYKGAVGYYTNEETNDLYVRNRTYKPEIGRWLSSDPAGIFAKQNLYDFILQPDDKPFDSPFPKFCQKVDEEPHAEGRCGGATARMEWVLEGFHPNPETTGGGGQKPTGTVIQKVTFLFDIYDCDKNLIKGDPETYYEAFYTYGRSVHPRFDRFRIPDRPHTYGTAAIAGEVAFVQPNLIKFPPWKRPDPDHPSSGQIPYLPSGIPRGWIGGNFFRGLVSEWFCCLCPDQRPTDVSKSFGWVDDCYYYLPY